MICVSDYVLLCTCDSMSVCGCMLMYLWYFCMFVCCPTYCSGCLMKSRGWLLNGQHLIPWIRVYRVDVL